MQNSTFVSVGIYPHICPLLCLCVPFCWMILDDRHCSLDFEGNLCIRWPSGGYLPWRDAFHMGALEFELEDLQKHISEISLANCQNVILDKYIHCTLVIQDYFLFILLNLSPLWLIKACYFSMVLSDNMAHYAYTS